ncbi:MAG: fatty acid oxidation complex subunit alpha FadB [Saccharospirillaceae bacterium]|nr:fatty acid oxidation complex subunit alpha FadB [Pseudomonadales bacterium]NRB78474.1 fatty acid oxidation complex subunit alpha FadB [Saccharospirillaceae bacterium]
MVDYFQLSVTDDDIALLCFDTPDESVNTLSNNALEQLQTKINEIQDNKQIKALLFYSGKKDLIFGADITEFLEMFDATEDDIAKGIMSVHELFNQIEDLPFPSLIVINGHCLGGGCELALSFDYRIMQQKAVLGLPEVKLGIFPGFAGTVRLPRLIGVDNAIEWICSGSMKKADVAFKDGAVNAVFETDDLKEVGLEQIKLILESKPDLEKLRAPKLGPIKLNATESMMAFETAKAFVAAKAGRHYPAPVAAINCIQKHAQFGREDAIFVELKAFAKIAKTSVAKNLVGLFIADQALKKNVKTITKNQADITQAAVLGAGIMGGGIAYQGASKGVNFLMKDINKAGLDLGLNEASTLFNKLISLEKITPKKMAESLNRIWPTMSYGDFNIAQVIIEAVVENPTIKQSVLIEAEQSIAHDAVLASNTSTISIDFLANSLKRPENFCGMHFFNPVHRMPLVEVIRGTKTSDQTIAKVVKLATQMGKSVVVVNDCAGFLVNRVLFPYFAGFVSLVKDAVDFRRIDKVMEKFGWPMGPAYLLDVVGLDTAVHAQAVMAKAYPDRMQNQDSSPIDVLFEQKRLGQKNDLGFYKYELDKKGKTQKVVDETVLSLLNVKDNNKISDEEIIKRMMIPLCLECIRCLDENIVASPDHADMAMIYGIGFPPFRGGPFKYMDDYGNGEGVAKFVEDCKTFEKVGPLYVVPQSMQKMAQANRTYYSLINENLNLNQKPGEL